MMFSTMAHGSRAMRPAQPPTRTLRLAQPLTRTSHITRAAPTFRPGTPADAAAIRALVLAERMNPLGLDPARFLVADGSDGGGLLAIGQRKQLNDNNFEISSLVTAPAARGAGVGAALLTALIAATPPNSRLWLTTIEPRVDFYKRAGFETVKLTAPGVPPSIVAEAAIGSVVARIAAGAGLVVMRRDV